MEYWDCGNFQHFETASPATLLAVPRCPKHAALKKPNRFFLERNLLKSVGVVAFQCLNRGLTEVPLVETC